MRKTNHNNLRDIATGVLLVAAPSFATPCSLPTYFLEGELRHSLEFHNPLFDGLIVSTQCVIQEVRTASSTRIRSFQIADIESTDEDFSNVDLKDLYGRKRKVRVNVTSIRKGDFQLSL